MTSDEAIVALARIFEPVEHKPDRWQVIAGPCLDRPGRLLHNSDIVLTATCSCTDDNCWWTTVHNMATNKVTVLTHNWKDDDGKFHFEEWVNGVKNA
jgi:hypothetical protein